MTKDRTTKEIYADIVVQQQIVKNSMSELATLQKELTFSKVVTFIMEHKEDFMNKW